MNPMQLQTHSQTPSPSPSPSPSPPPPKSHLHHVFGMNATQKGTLLFQNKTNTLFILLTQYLFQYSISSKQRSILFSIPSSPISNLANDNNDNDNDNDNDNHDGNQEDKINNHDTFENEAPFGFSCMCFNSTQTHLFVATSHLHPHTSASNTHKRPLIYILPVSKHRQSKNNNNNSTTICKDYEILEENGARYGYKCINCTKSTTHPRLCTISSSPDYLLSIWDWKEKYIVLQSKALGGPNISHLQCSLYKQDHFITCGTMGHIQFWNVASTFTGLKLQGLTGKFGKLELSDVSTVLELPNQLREEEEEEGGEEGRTVNNDCDNDDSDSGGRVLSGTNNGYLILWDGPFAYCRLVTSLNNSTNSVDSNNSDNNPSDNHSFPLHEGGIHHIHHDLATNYIWTTGADGTMKSWSIKDINASVIHTMNSGHSLDVPIQHIQVIEFSKRSQLVYFCPRDICSDDDNDNRHNKKEVHRWFVQDKRGILWDVDTKAKNLKKLWEFHSGVVKGIDTSPSEDTVVTVGTDGTVRCWNYKLSKPIAMIRYENTICTSVKWTPSHSVTSTGFCSKQSSNMISVGYNDGVIRFFNLDNDQSKLTLRQTFKPHTKTIHVMSFSKDGRYIATASSDGTIFLCLYHGDDFADDDSKPICSPIGFIDFRLPKENMNKKHMEGVNNEIVHLDWRYDGLAILCVTKSGNVTEVLLTSDHLIPVSEDIDTYLLKNVQLRHFQDHSESFGLSLKCDTEGEDDNDRGDNNKKRANENLSDCGEHDDEHPTTIPVFSACYAQDNSILYSLGDCKIRKYSYKDNLFNGESLVEVGKLSSIKRLWLE